VSQPPPSEVAAAPSAPGVDATASAADLVRRLTRMAAMRLLVLTGFLGIITFVYLRGQTGGFSSSVAFAAVALAYAASAIYGIALRGGRFLRGIAFAQLVTDQLLWTALVYVTGGVTSGGVSLYGLTCLVGAALLGVRGGLVALFAGAVAYLGLAVALLEGFLPIPSDQPPSVYVSTWADAAYPMLANLFALATVTGLASYLGERLREAGGDLEAARERAERAEQLASLGRLAAGLAHEIRNPLGSIAGSIELLGSSPGLSEEDKRLCGIVQREASRLNDLVGDMLELARTRPPAIGDVEAAVLAREVVELASQVGRGSDVTVEYVGPTHLRISADSAQMRQVLWNLVRNAVQASSPGDEVRVRLAKREGGGAVLEVSDAGPGIPEEAKGKLFDAFFTTRSQGTGVGLAVVKRIVDDHGWAIRVRSTDGRGATFSVLIPPGAVLSEEDRSAEA
jgi:signal transduction histidine kinase